MKKNIAIEGISNIQILIQDSEKKFRKADNRLRNIEYRSYPKLENTIKNSLHILPQGIQIPSEPEPIYYFEQGVQYNSYHEHTERINSDGSLTISRNFLPYNKTYKLVYCAHKAYLLEDRNKFNGSIGICLYNEKTKRYQQSVTKTAMTDFLYGDKFKILKPTWDEIITNTKENVSEDGRIEKSFLEYDKDGLNLEHKYYYYSTLPSIRDNDPKTDGIPLDYFLIRVERNKKILRIKAKIWFVPENDFGAWEYYFHEDGVHPYKRKQH